MSFKNSILEFINSTDHYNSIDSIAINVGCSYTTALKWIKELFQEKNIRRVNIGIYSAHYKYLSIKESEKIKKGRNNA